MLRRYLGFSILGILISLSIMGTATAREKEQPPLAELGFVNIRSYPDGDGTINPIRLQALRETATTLGARGALAWRSIHINAGLEQQTAYLDQVFDFNQLLLKDNVLPPVVAESSGDLNLDDPSTIRMADKTYKIISAARFVTSPPTWRNYLWLSYEKPDRPNATLLPTTQVEAQVWNQYLEEGWKEGLEQANDIFNANLSRLKRDYLGMVLYRKLLAQGIISSPHIAKADLGITGDSNEIRVNDAVMRITDQSKLQPNSNTWKPILTQ